MAGIVTPTIFFLVIATVFYMWRYVYDVPVPVERILIFPMAVVPNLWGVWNVLFVASHERTHLPIGVHGALLPLVLAPLGILLAHALNFRPFLSSRGFSQSPLPSPSSATISSGNMQSASSTGF
jgi:hypothetical protein